MTHELKKVLDKEPSASLKGNTFDVIKIGMLLNEVVKENYWDYLK